MTWLRWHVAAVLAGTALVPAQLQAGGQVEEATFADMAFKGPECVRYDSARDRYLVSNINGEMLAVDGNGFISRVAADGTGELKWIESGKNEVTLNAPKGMAIADDKIYVADIDHLRIFDAETGKPVDAIEISGAKFLNALAVASDGTIYVTDTGTEQSPGAIYGVEPGGKVRAVAEGKNLERPNGIAIDRDGNLIVVTYGSNKVLTLSTDGNVLNATILRDGQLDGLALQEDGSKLLSSWKGEDIVRLSPDDSSAEVVVTGVHTPAAFEVDEERGQMVVPLVEDNKVVVAPLG